MPSPNADRFFIAGCQRSGTTLLRLVLECHPDIYCLDEETSYPALARGDCPKPHGERWTGFKVPRWSEQFAQTIAQDEQHDVRAVDFYHGEPIVWLLRDVRDVIASMLKLQMTATQSWLEFCARPILEGKIARPDFAERWEAEIAQLRLRADSAAAVGALYWKYKNQALLDYQRRGYPILPIRYEALVRSPRRQLRQITNFLGIAWDDRLLHHAQLPHQEIYADGTAVGNTDPRRPIGRESLRQWNRYLSAGDLETIDAIAGDLCVQLGYDRPTQTSGLLHRWWTRWLGRSPAVIGGR